MLFSPVSATHRKPSDEADNERSPAQALVKLLRSTEPAADAWSCLNVHDSEQRAGTLAHDITGERGQEKRHHGDVNNVTTCSH
jgi:hypothetical protein